MNGTRPARDELGIRCPRCGCRHFYTTHTEPLRDGRIRRRKVCRHCGRKVVTFEAVPTSSRGRDC
jgi:transcriptional regulator NrdR family protein